MSTRILATSPLVGDALQKLGARFPDLCIAPYGSVAWRMGISTAEALVVLLSEPLTEDDHHLLMQVSDKPVIVILNKADLPPKISEDQIKTMLPKASIIRTSTVNDIGLTTLETAIEDAVNQNQVIQGGYSFITNVRHRTILEDTAVILKDIQSGIHGRQPYDLIEMDLRTTFELLGKITGDTVSEDLITSVFSQFCLGK